MNIRYIVRKSDNAIIEVQNSGQPNADEYATEDVRYLQPLQDISGFYLYEVKNGQIAKRDIENLPEYIDYKKQLKYAEIKSAFEDVFDNARFISKTIGVEVDGRRKDLQNIEGLIKIMKKDGIPAITYKCYKEFKEGVTVEDFEALIYEIIHNGNNLYAYKFQYEAQIQAAQTIADLDKIVWKD